MTKRTYSKFFSPMICAISLSGVAYGQLELSKDARFDVGDPSFEELQSPVISEGNGKRFAPKDWLEIEVEVKVGRLKEEPKDGYLDEFKVNWHVVVKGQDRKNYWIKKTVTHVNLSREDSVFVSIYLSPNTLRRITGKDRASKSDLEAIGGEIEYRGKMVGSFSHGEKDGWWTKTLKSVEVTQKFPLLNKTQTPFAPLWYDRYAEVKPVDAR